MSITLSASGPQPILLYAPDGPRTSFGFEYRMQLITILAEMRVSRGQKYNGKSKWGRPIRNRYWGNILTWYDEIFLHSFQKRAHLVMMFLNMFLFSGASCFPCPRTMVVLALHSFEPYSDARNRCIVIFRYLLRWRVVRCEKRVYR